MSLINVKRENREFLFKGELVVRSVIVEERLSKKHGTRYLYVQGCRCLDCTNAQRLYQKTFTKDKEAPSHGYNGYVNYGCRCDICKEAASAYRKLHPEFQRRYREKNREKERLRSKRWHEKKRAEKLK